MPVYFKMITERNKLSLNKPQNTDIIYYSELNEWYTGNAFRSFSIKCVLDNTIRYKVGAKEYVVNAGQYLVSLKQPDVKAYFQSSRKVKSICIDICPLTMGEVFTLATEKDGPELDNYLAGHFKYPEFIESVQGTRGSQPGPYLLSLAAAIAEGNKQAVVNKDWIYGLAEQVIRQEYGRFITLNNIRSVKPSTRKEIYRRVSIGREYIDQHFLTISNIGEAAAASNMSEYHFLRSFKQVYALTPYKYILAKKLELAKELLFRGDSNLTRIATACGFLDIFTFSKAFKRTFGCAPSVYLSRQRIAS
jgi:AraC family transcriptional regulator